MTDTPNEQWLDRILIGHAMFWSGGVVKPLDEKLTELDTNQAIALITSHYKSLMEDETERIHQLVVNDSTHTSVDWHREPFECFNDVIEAERLRLTQLLDGDKTDDISLCPRCNCMTRTLEHDTICGKCGEDKEEDL